MCSAQPRAQAFRAEVAQDHPQLQRAEPPAELHAGVHQVPHRAGLGRPQVLGRERERLAQHVHPPAVERAQVERREEPLVRVDDERVGAVRAGEDAAGTRGPSPPRRRRRSRRAARRLRARRSRRSPAPDRRSSWTSCRRWRRRRSGTMPAARSSAMAVAQRVRRASGTRASDGIFRSASWPRPSRITALSIDECAWSEQ